MTVTADPSKSLPVAYFDGQVATRREALLTLDKGQVTISCEGAQRSYPLAAITIPPGIGAVRRTIRLPDGGLCEMDDPALVAELEQARGAGRRAALLHRWERSLPLVLAALGVTVLVVALFLRFGVPTLARQAAFALPPAVEERMGAEALAVLDRMMTAPSKLTPERRAELIALFRSVARASGAAPGCRLEFRASQAIGANALALPAGIVVITDDLVALARHDDEIGAILAHELGHVQQRHILRHVLQNSATGLIMATLTGDLMSITSLAATLPTTLVDASFSRAFEREADDAAMAWMRTAGVPPRRYAEILGRLQAQLDVRHPAAAGGPKPIRNYLSTHPDTGERIRRVMQAEK